MNSIGERVNGSGSTRISMYGIGTRGLALGVLGWLRMTGVGPRGST